MAEWLKAHAWKACLGETLTWVRIPLSPPFSSYFIGRSTLDSRAESLSVGYNCKVIPSLRLIVGYELGLGLQDFLQN